jgi:hypothetical protein
MHGRKNIKLNSGFSYMQFKMDDSFSTVSKGNKHKTVTKFECRTMGPSLDMVYLLDLFLISGNKGSVTWNTIKRAIKGFCIFDFGGLNKKR